MNTAELMARPIPFGATISLPEVKAQPAVKEVIVDEEREANVEVISRDIVYRAALQDVTKGDRLSFFKPHEISPKIMTQKTANILKALGNGVIRGFETVTGIKAVRLAENQMLATRALELQLAGKPLSQKEEAILRKLNLSKFVDVGGRDQLIAEVEAGKSLQSRRESIAGKEKEQSGFSGKVLRFLTGKLDEKTIRGIYLNSVDLESQGVSVENKKLRNFVTTTVIASLGIGYLKAHTASISWVLGAGAIIGMTGVRAYERSKISTQEFLNNARYRGLPNAPYVSSEGVNQTLSWGTVVALARSYGAYFNAAQRLENNDFITRVISSGDMQSLGESMRTGNTDAAIELLAANAVRMLFNEGGDMTRMAQVIEEAEDIFITLGDNRFSELNARIAFLSARKANLNSTILVENVKDVRRAMVMSATCISLGSFLRDFFTPVSAEAHAATPVVAERPAIPQDFHENLPKAVAVTTVVERPRAAVVLDQTPLPTRTPIAEISPQENAFIHLQNAPKIENPVPVGPAGIEVFRFDSSGAADIAKKAHAYLFRSDANYFHNVFRSDKFKPDFQIRIPSKFGPGNGTFTPLNENMHISLGGKFHDELKGLLIQKGILKTSDYKPENVGYTVYIKDGNHNQVLTVTRDSNITGLKIDKDGNLDMDPSIQAKVDGFSVVYVDKSGDSVKGIYNIGRIVNAKGHTGDAEFMVVNPNAPKGPSEPLIISGNEPNELKGSFNLNDDNAPVKLAEHGATMVVDGKQDPSIIKDVASGAFKINDQPIPTNTVHVFNPSIDKDLVFEDTMSPDALIKKLDKAVDTVAGSDISMNPDQLKWQLWFFDPTKRRYIKLIVDRNTHLSGITISDKGLSIKPSISMRLVEVDKIYYGPKQTIILELARVAKYNPTSMPDFLDTDSK